MALQVAWNPSREAWNGFMASRPGASLYQSYEWGALRGRHGWTPEYVAVLDDRGAWAGAALILVKRLPSRFGALLYSPKGPVLERPEAMPALLAAARDLAHRHRAIFWRIEPPFRAEEREAARFVKASGFVSVPQEWSYWNTPKYEMHLDLSPGETAVFEALGRKNRWKVRAGAKQVKISVGTADEDLEAFHALLKRTAEKKAIAMRGLEYYRHCRDILAPGQLLAVFVARKEGRPVAAGITTRYGSTARLLHMSNDYSEPNSAWALQWDMIRWAMVHGCRLYDFAGTATHFPPRETDKGYGVYQFKRGFRAEIIAWYGYADSVFRPAWYGAFRTMERMLPLAERLALDWPKAWLERWHAHRKRDSRYQDAA